MVTANQAVRGGKAIDLKKTVDTAVESCPSVKSVFVWQRTDKEYKPTKKDVNLDKVIRIKIRRICLIEEIDLNKLLHSFFSLLDSS